MRPVHTGPVRREVVKCVGSPDSHHRTRPECPVPYSENTANAQGHRTHTTGRSLSIRCSLSEAPAENRQRRTRQQSLANVRCLASGASFTSAKNQERTEHAGAVSGASKVSVRWVFFHPRLLQTFHRRNRKYVFYFLKNAESRLASSTGGRNPNPSLPFKLHLLLKVCQHHYVCTNMCKCVSIFTIIFFKGVKLAH